MNDRMRQILAPGRVAVITGAATGIGAALAKELASRGMRLSLLDLNSEGLSELVAALSVEVISTVGDVSDPHVLEQLRDATIDRFGDLALLVNNAGIAKGGGPWEGLAPWRRQLEVNFFSIVQSQHLFVPYMIATNQPAAVVNLGSKEGITTPPGNAAYSVAKAGVKVLTEQLEHELRNATNGRVSAHLLVPGYTYTPMNFPDAKPGDAKPEAPVSAEELVETFLHSLGQGEFYIICKDNEVSSELDARRIQWAADDMIKGRPALSRWHPDFREEFSNFVADLRR